MMACKPASCECGAAVAEVVEDHNKSKSFSNPLCHTPQTNPQTNISKRFAFHPNHQRPQLAHGRCEETFGSATKVTNTIYPSTERAVHSDRGIKKHNKQPEAMEAPHALHDDAHKRTDRDFGITSVREATNSEWTKCGTEAFSEMIAITIAVAEEQKGGSSLSPRQLAVGNVVTVARTEEKSSHSPALTAAAEVCQCNMPKLMQPNPPVLQGQDLLQRVRASVESKTNEEAMIESGMLSVAGSAPLTDTALVVIDITVFLAGPTLIDDPEAVTTYLNSWHLLATELTSHMPNQLNSRLSVQDILKRVNFEACASGDDALSPITTDSLRMGPTGSDCGPKGFYSEAAVTMGDQVTRDVSFGAKVEKSDDARAPPALVTLVIGDFSVPIKLESRAVRTHFSPQPKYFGHGTPSIQEVHDRGMATSGSHGGQDVVDVLGSEGLTFACCLATSSSPWPVFVSPGFSRPHPSWPMVDPLRCLLTMVRPGPTLIAESLIAEPVCELYVYRELWLDSLSPLTRAVAGSFGLISEMTSTEATFPCQNSLTALSPTARALSPQGSHTMSLLQRAPSQYEVVNPCSSTASTEEAHPRDEAGCDVWGVASPSGKVDSTLPATWTAHDDNHTAPRVDCEITNFVPAEKVAKAMTAMVAFPMGVAKGLPMGGTKGALNEFTSSCPMGMFRPIVVSLILQFASLIAGAIHSHIARSVSAREERKSTLARGERRMKNTRCAQHRVNSKPNRGMSGVSVALVLWSHVMTGVGADSPGNDVGGSPFSTTDFQALSSIYTMGKQYSPQISRWNLDNRSNLCSGGVDGITCDVTNSFVTSLNLTGANLTGPIANFVANFSSLEYLHLADNKLYGSIPSSLTQSSTLVWVDLSNNHLSHRIPTAFTNLRSLQWLDLSSNQLTGSIPDSIVPLPSLQALLVSDNYLTGHIPPVSNSLLFLNVRQNRLNGKIDALVDYSGIFYCDLSFNNFSVSLPSSVFALGNLNYLFLRSNRFSGHLVIPAGSVAAQHLVTLDLGSNLLSGQIPSALGEFDVLSDLFLFNNAFVGSIPTSLSNLQYLQYLDVNTNKLNGSIPHEFGNLSSLATLYLNDNSFEGSVPAAICGLSNLVNLDLSDNKLGHMCSFASDVSSPSSEVPMATLLVGDTQMRSLDANQDPTPSPTVIATVAAAPLLVRKSSLARVLLSGNAWMESERNLAIMMSKFRGLSSLGLLALDNASLTGPMPLNMAPFRSLVLLNLSYNSISGSLPSSLGALQNLNTIDLTKNAVTGTLPSELGHIANMSVFKLSNNSIQGAIPATYANWKDVIVVSLARNSLSGSIPLEFNALEKLRVLDLSSNQLNGEMHFIDASKQKALQLIDVSQNRFTGAIPSDVFRLKNLSVFSASSNCFKEAHVSKDICSADSNIEVIAMDGISQGECETFLPFLYKYDNGHWTAKKQPFVYSAKSKARSGRYPYVAPEVTFDNCIFQAPRLTTLHLSSNNIDATLPEIVPASQLKDLVLSVNKIKGTIPRRFQEHPWTIFDVSNNKLSGTLADTIFNREGSSLSVQINRLSGPVPVAILRALGNVNVLEGNYFSCPVATEQQHLPQKDSYIEYYKCGGGSNSVILEVLSLATFCGAVVLVWAMAKSVERLKGIWNEAIDVVVRCKSDIQKSGLEMPNTIEALNVFVDVMWWFVLTASFGAVVLLPVYCASKSDISYYSVVFHSGVWLASGAFIHGEGAAAIMFMFWTLMNITIRAVTRHCFGVATESDEAPASAWTTIKSSMNAVISNPVVTSKLLLVSLVNIALMFTSKVVYQAVNINVKESSEIQGMNMFLTAFTAIWVNMLKPLLIWARGGTHIATSPRGDVITNNTDAGSATSNAVASGGNAVEQVEERDEIVLHAFLVILNNIFIPMVAASAVSPECLRNYFFEPEAFRVAFGWSSGNCLISVNTPFSVTLGSFHTTFDTSRCLFSLSLSADHSFMPPFNYSYICGSAILTTFVGFFLFSMLTNSCAVPLVMLMRTKIWDVLAPAINENNVINREASMLRHAKSQIGADANPEQAQADPEHITLEEGNNASGHVDEKAEEEHGVKYWLRKGLGLAVPTLLQPLDTLVKPMGPSVMDTIKEKLGLSTSQEDSPQPVALGEENENQEEAIAEDEGALELFPRRMFVVKVVGYMAILLTFGTVFSILGIVIAVATCFEVVFNMFLVAVFVSRLLGFEDKVKAAKLRLILERDLAGMRKGFRKSMGLVGPQGTFFYTWFLFDMIGDTRGDIEASWGPVLMVTAPLIIGGMFLLVNHFIKLAEGKDLLDCIPIRRSSDSNRRASMDLDNLASMRVDSGRRDIPVDVAHGPVDKQGVEPPDKGNDGGVALQGTGRIL